MCIPRAAFAVALAVGLLTAPFAVGAQATKVARVGILSTGNPHSAAIYPAFELVSVNYDPIELGYIASLARPGGNVTGLTTMSGDLSPKRLEVLKETLPGLTRVAVLWNAGNPTATRFFKDMESAAPQFGIRLQALGSRGAGSDDVQNAADAATSSNFVGCSTGRSAGLAPRRILSTYRAGLAKHVWQVQ